MIWIEQIKFFLPKERATIKETKKLIQALEISIDALNYLKNSSLEEEEVDSGMVYRYSHGALCEIEKLGESDE